MALFLTKAGLAALVEAEESGIKLQATHMALGDGNGLVPEHTTSSPSLINEVWRGALQSITINEQGDTDAGKQVVFEAHVPINAGGWYIREVALYAGDVLLAIGTHPVMWKPAPEEPTKMEHVIKAPVTFGNAGVVSLVVDPTVVLASQEFVNKQIATHDDLQDAHPQLREILDKHSHGWNEIQDKPSAFPPKSHGHDWDEISEKPAAFPPSGHNHAWSTITSKPETFPPSGHSHTWVTITGKPTTFPPASHNHTWTAITGRPSTFPPSGHNHDASYAPKSHTHPYAPSSHSHAWNTITSKPTTFPPSGHNHDDRYYTESEVNLKLAGLVVKPIGLIELMPYRPDALPAHHYMCNGEGLSKTSAAGKRLRSLPSTFKSDWGITENSTHVFLPNVFSGSDGYFFRAVNGSNRLVGNKQNDAIRNVTGKIKAVGSEALTGANVEDITSTGALYISDEITSSGGVGSGRGMRSINFSMSRSGVPTSHENRPKNVGMTPVIYLPPM